MATHSTFYWGKEVTLLFDDWKTTSLLEYLLSLLGVFIFAIIHEWLMAARVYFAAGYNSRRIGGDVCANITVGFLYGINAGTMYLLILLVVSFNGGVLLAAVAGLAVGHSFFAKRDTT